MPGGGSPNPTPHPMSSHQRGIEPLGSKIPTCHARNHRGLGIRKRGALATSQVPTDDVAVRKGTVVTGPWVHSATVSDAERVQPDRVDHIGTLHCQ